uniref:Uncharacterized protein n=2 Tax=Leviviricetes TaxID=2842243 RepID=A0A514D8Q6_9VIRU|nr:MAG: hypothetical protein H1Bulk29184_000001 [Leviviridae sp.]
MAPIGPPQNSGRKDTRGLPEGYDPHMLYEYRYHVAKENASGLEKFAYQYLPKEFIKSSAFAIDPTGPFKVAPGVITPANRTKVRQTASVLNRRQVHITRNVTSFAPRRNYGGVSGCNSPFIETIAPVQPDGYFDLRQQEPFPDVLHDTTSRTRLMGSKQGTLDYFKGFINSPSRRVSTHIVYDNVYNAFEYPPTDPCIVLAGGTAHDHNGGTDVHTNATVGAGAFLLSSSFHEIRNREQLYNTGLMQANAVNLLKGWSPFNRETTLFRNLVELRDIPRSVLQLQSTLRNLKTVFSSLATSTRLRKIVFDLKRTSKDIPNEYLSYHFGWKQTWKDVNELLASPGKISKRVKFLIDRSGKPTTFRSKRSFVSGASGVSAFDYEQFGDEYAQAYSSRVERTSELRLVINSTFDFPPPTGMRFFWREYYKRLGIEPRVTDVYNLVPWTWLVDWFTGLGNYVELIDNINHDPSLINWGMLSCHTAGKYITDYTSKSDRYYLSSVNGEAHNEGQPSRVSNPHTSVYDFECHTRSDVATILDVKTTAEPSTMTAYQQSIIGALLSQRLDFSRKGGFKPRS